MADKPSNVRQLTPITGGAPAAGPRITPDSPRAWVTPLAIGAAVASAAWLLVVAIYIQTQYGWESVAQLLPHELGAGIAGVAAPLAFLWLVVAFVERGRELRRQVDLLGHQLDGLIYQPASDSARYQSVAQGLREQAKIL